MYDIEIHMKNETGQLAALGQAVGAAGHNVLGGGMWLVENTGVAHYLFEDGPAVQAVLEDAGFMVVACRPVIVQRLSQDEPGQLGKFAGAIADAGVNIEVLYSDHDHQLIIAVSPDDHDAARAVSTAWMVAR